VCYITLRGKTFYKKTFFACLSSATLFVTVLPLFATQTASYGAARKVCHDYVFVLYNAAYWDVESPLYDPEWDIFAVHLFNSISTVVSLFGFWVWLFFSPHMSDVARDLDRTCTETRLPSSKHATNCHLPTLLVSRDDESRCLSFSFTVGSYFAL
jgi:hypothetical protein